MFFRERSKHNWREIFIKYGVRLASLSNHQEIYKTLLMSLAEVSGAESASLLLFDQDLNQFTLKQQLGPTPLSFSVPLNHPLILWLRKDGCPLVRHDLVQDRRLMDLKSQVLVYFSEWKVEVAFPLIAEKKFLGIFNLGGRGERAYDPEDIELFSTLISLGSLFIENGNLYETLLKQNQQLAEVARLKTQFISNITHELRTPLHGILGLADILIEDPHQCMPEDYRRYLSMMKNAGEELLQVVDHILDLTKYQSGLICLDVKKHDLKKIILAAFQELKKQFENQECELVLDWPDQTPGVYGDEVELKYLLRDLLNNAVKFTRKGTVSISPGKCGEMLKICVKDSGVGIDEKDQELIFEEFRQADGDIDRHFGGTGLGLAIAKKIVELHGGRIWVESKKGYGASFYFTLPLNPSYIQTQNKS